jgi:hypothetical protein
MTKKHFEAMAEIVNNIRTGDWDNATCQSWARSYIKDAADAYDAETACHVAEAFMTLAVSHNPRFDRERFLRACGLVR